MIRVLAFIRRLPNVSRDAFRTHYEQVHVRVALPFLTGTTGYLRHHVREELFGRPDFDCMTRFEYPDPAAVRAVFERIEGPGADAIRRDERRFMDKPAIVFFPVEEGPGWGLASAGTKERLLLLCIRRPEAEPSESFRAGFLEESLPALRAAVQAPRWLRPWLALPGPAPSGGFDAVIEIEAEGAGGLAGWARALEAKGAHVIAMAVSVHATRMAG
jgi:hypothetical protein